MAEGPHVPPTRVCLEPVAQCFKGSIPATNFLMLFIHEPFFDGIGDTLVSVGVRLLQGRVAMGIKPGYSSCGGTRLQTLRVSGLDFPLTIWTIFRLPFTGFESVIGELCHALVERL